MKTGAVRQTPSYNAKRHCRLQKKETGERKAAQASVRVAPPQSPILNAAK